MILTCPICGKAFTKYPWDVQRTKAKAPTCSLPCRNKQCSLRQKGHGRKPIWLIEGQKRAYQARMEAVVKFHFGKLSEREIALFRHVWKIAYNRGYFKAWNGQRTKRERAA